MVARILSYLKLPTGDSVKTSVLSKRWEFLWLMVSSLDLDVINLSRDGGEALARFMHMFLELNRGSSSCLKHDDSMDDCNKRVMEWIAEVVHGGVQHLDVDAKTCGIIQSHPDIYKSTMCSPSVDSMPKVCLCEQDSGVFKARKGRA
ncbi:putative leucine-rich repeat domain superfamily [Arabidopsis thaliana]